MRIIYYWADGTWVDKEEYSEAGYAYKSDDFGTVELADDFDDEDVDKFILDKVSQ
jgi:hypothetical protein